MWANRRHYELSLVKSDSNNYGCRSVGVESLLLGAQRSKAFMSRAPDVPRLRRGISIRFGGIPSRRSSQRATHAGQSKESRTERTLAQKIWSTV